MVIGIASIALVFEATRRTMGFALPLICAIFLAYACSVSTFRDRWRTAAMA